MSSSQRKNVTWVLENERQWRAARLPSLFLDAIFRESPFRASFEQELADSGTEVTSLEHLIELAREALDLRARRTKSPDVSIAEHMLELANYVENMHDALVAYETDDKPNPTAVWYPNPTRPGGTSIYDTLPIVTNHGIVTRSTPIGSAGSCFAFEISTYLQQHGFNYVVTESGEDVEHGVIQGCPGPPETLKYARFCANWGILFNTPTIAQLAEKAFGERELPRLLVHAVNEQGNLLYSDPFRENVWFSSPEAYEANYEQHREATRKALLAAEVFIVTMGLNECWQFMGDGSFISLSPRSSELTALLRHRVLTVEENVAYLQRFVDVVRAHNRNIKVIISVSPVPLRATGLGATRHVMTANCHSKAVLRVAAEELVTRNHEVYYLPSYELVTTGIDKPWDPDERHVKRSAVQRVMSLFEACFVQPTSEPAGRRGTPAQVKRCD
jgi:GSCFA family